MTAVSPDKRFAELLAKYEADYHLVSQRRARLQSFHRLLLVSVLGLFLAAYYSTPVWELCVAGSLVLLVMAVVVFRRMAACQHQMQTAADMADINRHAIARRQRDWDGLPAADAPCDRQQLPLSVDLDLFGNASLMQLVCTAETEDGIETLADWLVNGVDRDELTSQHEVVRALAPLLQWRQDLQRRCLLIRDSRQQVKALKDWAESPTAVSLPKFLELYALALRILTPACLLWAVLFPSMVSALALLALLIIHFVITVFYAGEIDSHFRSIMVTPDAPSFHFLSDTFAHISREAETQRVLPGTAAICDQAVAGFRRLERILVFESVSRNSLTFFWIFLPLQFLFLWNLQVFMAAAKWRESQGRSVNRWFAELGRIEALASLASLSFEQPTWKFPELSDAVEPELTAAGLGHPLLPDSSRVTNDVSIGPMGTMLMITGSNMGGKSTLLRAVGVNAILAQAGGPCCCDSLKMTPLKVMTSMRVADSLSDATSFFMAQLVALKRIVDHLKAHQDGRVGPAVLYLFDEILDGTNTTDRRIGVESLVGYLLSCRAIGAMTTHDLEIARESKYKHAYQTYYLSHQLAESESRAELKFDYKLREGISPSSNAQILIRMLGLPTE